MSDVSIEEKDGHRQSVHRLELKRVDAGYYDETKEEPKHDDNADC